MTYKTIDGTIITSGSEPIEYSCSIPENIMYSVGTFESLETASNVNGDLVQIHIKRVLSEGICVTTITERSQEEINSYIEEIKNDNI